MESKFELFIFPTLKQICFEDVFLSPLCLIKKLPEIVEIQIIPGSIMSLMRDDYFIDKYDRE